MALLGGPWDVSLQFMRKWINLIVFYSWGYTESKSIREILRGPWEVPPKFYKYKEM